MALRLSLLVFFLSAFTITGLADSYRLDWPHVNSSVRAKPAPKERQQVAPFLQKMPDITPAGGYANRWLRANVQETRDFSLQAHAYFNHDIQDYHFVDVVEVSLLRSGQFESEVLYNTAQHRNFGVQIPSLATGDQYRVKIFWADGSYRILEGTVGVYADLNPVVDEPDFLLGPIW